MHKNYFIECFVCGKKTDEKENTTICRYCGGPLDVIYDYDAISQRLNLYNLKNSAPTVMKYLDFYPFSSIRDLHSLNEGSTPLHPALNFAKKMELSNLFIKNEGLNPTGAFKDRGSFVEINKAKQLGFKRVVVASTGNMAASVSAYCTQSGLECYVFVPENTPRGKLAQAISYGARVIQVRGTYEDAYQLAVETGKFYGYYLAGDYAFRGEGQKSLAYEVCEQLDFADIDFCIVPVGMGTNLSYIFKGFWEYCKLGLIKKIPRMVAVQAQGSSPVVDAIEKHRKLQKVKKPQTVCSAISVGNPIDAVKVFEAVKSSDGLAVKVNDDETLKSQQELARKEAMYVEPSSATVLAALWKLRRSNMIKKDDVVVLVATGAGLKDPAITLKVIAEPPTIEPMLSEVKRILSANFLSIRAGGVADKEKLLFKKVPAISVVKKTVSREFSLDLDKKTLEIIRNVIAKFIRIKGKTIAKADLQSIIETVIADERRKKVLEITDFHIETFKKKKPRAVINLVINGKNFAVEDDGVGPVDAAIKAITKAIKKQDRTKFRLVDFNVEIPTTGSDATVEAVMVLRDIYGTQVVEKGTSPDIIVASIEAYEKGYNELVYQRTRNGSGKKDKH